MQADKIIAGIERFFYDIIGSLIPGALLLYGLRQLLGPELVPWFKPLGEFSSADCWLFAGLAFVVGNGMATFGERILVPISVWIAQKCPESMVKRKTVLSTRELEESLAERQTTKAVSSHLFGEPSPKTSTVSSLRNVAMSIIPADDKATVIRFMFLSLMSLGVATATVLLVCTATVLNFLMWPWWHSLAFVGAGSLFYLLFSLRRFDFFNRSQRLPFDMAAAVLLGRERSSSPCGSEEASRSSQGIRSLYLAGGHRGDWREQVADAVPHLAHRNPAKHGLADPRAYTAWDLEAVKRSDVLFAYFDAENPSGFGMVLEVGYAVALSKHVVFVDEKSRQDEGVGRYLKIVHQAANVSFESLEDGIQYLKTLAGPLSQPT